MAGPQLWFTPDGETTVEFEFAEESDPFAICEAVRARLFPREFEETESKRKEEVRARQTEAVDRAPGADRAPGGGVAPAGEVAGRDGQGGLF